MAKTEPSSTDESFEDIVSAPAESRRDYSGEYSGSSKFVEAMKNPDWRCRRDDSSLQQSTLSGTGSFDLIPSQARTSCRTSGDGDSTQTLESRKTTSSWDHIDSANHWRSSGNGSEIDVDGKNWGSVDEAGTRLGKSNIPTTELHDSSIENRGLCTLIDHMELPGLQSKGRQVSIIKLAPFSAMGGFWHHYDWINTNKTPIQSMAQIQRLTIDDRQVSRINNEKHEPDYELQMLTTADDTLPRQRHFASRLQFQTEKELEEQSQMKRLEKERETVLLVPPVANIEGIDCQRQAKPNTSKQPVSLPKSPNQNPEFESRHEAFQKMLQKLQRGAQKAATTIQDKTRDACCNHACPWGPTIGQQPSATRELRKINKSDSGIDLLHIASSRSKESSQDSGVCIGPDALSKGLNPRAREFLSFRGGIPMPTEKHDPRDDSSHSPCNLAHEKVAKGDDLAATNPALFGSPFPTIPVDQGPDKMDGISCQGPGAIPISTLGSTSLGSMPSLSPFSSFAFPLSPYQSLGLSAIPGLPSGMLPGAGLGTSAAGCSPPVDLANQFNLPGIGPTTQPLSVTPSSFPNNISAVTTPCGPLAAMGCANSKPHPVPKPVNPNPAQQQAYEAWIEWRKANEPGYALECRNRQQRRAQRNMGTTPNLCLVLGSQKAEPVS
ncbi:hypothetical protein NM208_g13597 [Fusarium decemcellulare]|uniref:Uncharacterized protein n=1 Tax=Fusarium decemcellulare TaxID=57161 RepID=A0ACC1RLS4_9HYPO|nr:hypothetical protein NM208_g13597 [Fusarium decemcellulare]